MDYTYEAIKVNPRQSLHGRAIPCQWMVKRWVDNPHDYTESLVEAADEQAAVKAAIERGSWA